MADGDEAARALCPHLNISIEDALEWVDALHAEGLRYEAVPRLADRVAESVRRRATERLAFALGIDPPATRRWVDELHALGLSHADIFHDAELLADSIKRAS